MKRLAQMLGALIGLTFATLAAGASPVEPITLRVALYPYIPDYYTIFARISREFQRKHPGVVLDLIEVDPNKDYYEDGLLTLSADVYEIDSILLGEMIKAGKIDSLPLSLNGFAPESVEAVTRNGTVYALPHWMCGNFLFYQKTNAGIRDAATWAELLVELQRQNKNLFIDFFGRLTLGEFYVTLMADRIGVQAAQNSIMTSSEPDPQVVSDLKSILLACPIGFCRSKDLHDRSGFYARAFARGDAAAYIGYSESLHYALQEIIDNCRAGTACLSPNDIAVRRLPALVAGTSPDGIGWIDGLAIASGLSETKKKIARSFIEFATSDEAYQLVLKPDWMNAPRYLLPARTGMDLSGGPLYSALFAAQQGRKTGTTEGLNERLRTISKKVNCLLPIDRTDTKTDQTCRIQ